MSTVEQVTKRHFQSDVLGEFRELHSTCTIKMHVFIKECKGTASQINPVSIQIVVFDIYRSQHQFLGLLCKSHFGRSIQISETIVNAEYLPKSLIRHSPCVLSFQIRGAVFPLESNPVRAFFRSLALLFAFWHLEFNCRV
jgi:hypothetical protein